MQFIWYSLQWVFFLQPDSCNFYRCLSGTCATTVFGMFVFEFLSGESMGPFTLGGD